jgi:hypothetical protein
MGNFYVNFTVKEADPQRLAQALQKARCSAFLTPPERGYVVVFEEQSDNQDPSAIERVGKLLSCEAGGPVLGMLNHDDDILAYWLFENGAVTDSYESNPNYFDDGDGSEGEQGGDARRLVAAFPGGASADEVDDILREEDVTFAIEQHERLVRALRLPMSAVGLGYRYISEGELPPDLEPDQLLRV